MSQLNYTIDTEVGVEGQVADSRQRTVLSSVAGNDIDFGRGVLINTFDERAYLPANDTNVITFATDFVEDNVIEFSWASGDKSFTVTVASGDTQGDVETAIVNKLEANDFQASVTGTREITVLGAPVVNFTITVTGGASQTTASQALSIANGVFGGFALLTHNIEQDSDNKVQYKRYRNLNRLTQGSMYVKGETALAIGDTLYLRTAGTAADIGKLRSSADGSDTLELSGVSVEKGAAAGELATIAINLP